MASHPISNFAPNRLPAAGGDRFGCEQVSKIIRKRSGCEVAALRVFAGTSGQMVFHSASIFG